MTQLFCPNAHLLRLLLEKKPKDPKIISSVTRIFCLWKDVLYIEFCRNRIPWVQHKFTLWFDLVCPETWHHSHPQNNCCPHATGVWLAWRRGIYPRGQENKSELFLVALIKILVFGQENFLAQFLILHCTIGLPRWIRGGIKPNKHTQHPPKKPKSSHSKANTQEGLWAQPVHELRLIKQPKTERDDPNVSPASPAQPGGRTVLLLPGHGGWLDQVNITKSSTDKNHSRDPAILQPCCP